MKHIGFSFHDDFELFEEVLDAADWDFCQIQLNYYDQEFQAGLKGLQLAAERGLGVVIMEPLRGGFLVDLPPKVQEVLDKATDKSPVELAFDWLWNMPEVSTVLSGMSSMEMLQEDIAFAEKAKPGMLSAEDTAVIEQLRESFNQFSVVPCTGCNYCVEYCPEKIVIPYNFTAYNMRFLYDNMDMAREYYQVEVPKFGRTAGISYQHRGLHFHKSASIQEIADLLEDLRTFYKGVFYFRIHDEIHISLTITDIRVGQSVKFLRQNLQTLGQQYDGLCVNGDLSHLGAEYGTFDSDNITDIHLLEISISLFAYAVSGNIRLDIAL